MATTFLSTTLGTPTSSRIWTFSTWLKRCGLASGQHIFSIDNGSQRDAFSFDSDDGLRLYFNGSATGYADLSTNRVLRDTSAFYHLVIAVDTTQATAANRVKLYINGTQYTWDETTVYGNQNYDTFNASGNTFRIGRDRTAAAYFDGILAHTHFIDGTQYAASTFGETDSTSGIWKPKTAPSVTYGNNGFFLKFENSGNLDLDSSGNNRSFTTSGTLTQNVDTPTNNYATLTPLYTIEYKSSQFFTNGNNTTNSNTTQWNTNPCTMEVSSGKWYFEGYGHTNGSNYVHYGITSSEKMGANATQAQQEINAQSNGYAYSYYGYNGSIYYSTTSASSSASYGATFGSSDYIGIFADLDNNKLYFAKNGTLQNSGTGYSINADGKPYILATAVYSGLTNVNFGSGVFGTTVLTGTTYADANGHGTFKYSPNQGGAANFDSAAKNFYAMNTKNLKEFG